MAVYESISFGYTKQPRGWRELREGEVCCLTERERDVLAVVSSVGVFPLSSMVAVGYCARSFCSAYRAYRDLTKLQECAFIAVPNPEFLPSSPEAERFFQLYGHYPFPTQFTQEQNRSLIENSKILLQGRLTERKYVCLAQGMLTAGLLLITVYLVELIFVSSYPHALIYCLPCGVGLITTATVVYLLTRFRHDYNPAQVAANKISEILFPDYANPLL